MTRGIDRKLVLLFMTGLMLLSGLIVALAPSYTVLMIGRALLGVTIGGFLFDVDSDGDAPRASRRRAEGHRHR